MVAGTLAYFSAGALPGDAVAADFVAALQENGSLTELSLLVRL